MRVTGVRWYNYILVKVKVHTTFYINSDIAGIITHVVITIAFIMTVYAVVTASAGTEKRRWGGEWGVGGWRERERDRQTDRQTDRDREGQRETERETQTDRQTQRNRHSRQTSWQAERQSGRRTDR